MNRTTEQPRADLVQRLEILRVQGGRHRLELALSLERLLDETGAIRRGAATALSLLGMVAGSGAGKGLMRTVLRGLVPVALSLFAGTRAARSAGRLRSTLELGALGLIVFRFIRRVLREPRPAPAESAQAPPASGSGDRPAGA